MISVSCFEVGFCESDVCFRGVVVVPWFDNHNKRILHSSHSPYTDFLFFSIWFPVFVKVIKGFRILRENADDQIVIGFSIAADWWREWCDFPGLRITKLGKA